MTGLLSAPDAALIAAIVTAAAGAWATWRTSRQALKETRPNGGSSMRDAIDRIEDKLDKHTERLAVLEATTLRRGTERTRSTDQGDHDHAA